MRKLILYLILACSVNLYVTAQMANDHDKQKTLYVVGTAHFDTQWLWTIKTSIDEYVPNTMKANFRLFEKHPFYKFSFEGAFKYMLMKEYYPNEFQKVKDYIKTGQWNICGSSIDAFDVNIPSPYALSRSILLGQQFYAKEFATVSRDIFLPDCFGFGYALPTIANFCGLKGFSTQKLGWGSSVGIPFDLCAWQGVDGSKILAALNAGDYNADIKTDLSNDPEIINMIEKTGKSNLGIYKGYRYFGVGDRGGSPRDTAIFWLEKSIQGNGPVKVENEGADFLCKQLTPSQLNQLPVYNSELLMTTHGTGCYTSQAAMKRWNRKNELIAESAEKASTMAYWMGALYPQQKINDAYTRFLWHQFHDDLTGTSIPEAYNYSWNDELLSLNQFSSVLENASASVINLLNTKTKHIPLVVYNPLSVAREDFVEAEVILPKEVEGIRVYNKEGKEIPSQILNTNGNKAKILFLATVPSVGYEVYEIQQVGKVQTYVSELKASNQSIENGQYVMFFDPKTADIKRIIEKSKMRDLLVKPLRWAFFDNVSEDWPAWEIKYNTVNNAPRGYLEKVKSFEVVENGPIRVSVKIVRERDGSEFTQYIRMYSGKPGERIEFTNEVKWNTKGTILKAEFPFAISTSKATYDLGMGVIQRGNNTEKLYEVPAQQWADVATPDGAFGISIFSDCKYGWDKPTDNIIRLSLIHTPKVGKDFGFQATNDLGFHKFSYAMYPHYGDWKKAKTQWIASIYNQPLMAFQTSSHEGSLGKSFSFINLNTTDVMVKSIKKAENSDEIVIHVQELIGARAGNVKVGFPIAVVSAREINGAEENIGNARIENEKLEFDINPFQPKAFAIKLGTPANKIPTSESIPLALDYNLFGVSSDESKATADLDGKGNSIPAEQYPAELISEGIKFKMANDNTGKNNILKGTGQQLAIPQGNYNKVYILACALKDTKATFLIDGKENTQEIPYFTGFIGQWDGYNRKTEGANDSIAKGFLKKVPVAWNSTHLHHKDGNKSYEFAYLFKLDIELPKGAKTLTLPNDPNIIISAITVANDVNAGTTPAQVLGDNYFK